MASCTFAGRRALGDKEESLAKAKQIAEDWYRKLPVVLLATFVPATAMSTFAQNPTDAAQPSVKAIDPAEAAARTAAGKPLVDVEAVELATLAPAVANPESWEFAAEHPTTAE